MIRTTSGQTCVELWMVMDALDVHLYVGEGLGVAVHVPLTQPDPQLLRPGHMGMNSEELILMIVNLNLLTQ